MSLARFTLASLLVSAIYPPLSLRFVLTFGDALDNHIGFWAWPILFAAIAASSYVRKRVFVLPEAAAPDTGHEMVLPASCFGMPPLHHHGNVNSLRRHRPQHDRIPLRSLRLVLRERQCADAR